MTEQGSTRQLKKSEERNNRTTKIWVSLKKVNQITAKMEFYKIKQNKARKKKSSKTAQKKKSNKIEKNH